METVIVYWSPFNYQENNFDWNILYEDPVNCYEDLLQNNNLKSNNNNFFLCPAFKNLMKNTFVIKNPIESEFDIIENKIFIKSNNYINSEIIHQPSIKNNILLDYGISHLFFSEQELEILRTPPYFHNVQNRNTGSVVPGKFNCGSWFRPIRNEFNIWDNVTTIKILENEPISYITFITDKRVVLKRFSLNKKLMDIAKTCSTSSDWEKKVPLVKRYNRFKNTKTNKIVINEIKKNLVDEYE